MAEMLIPGVSERILDQTARIELLRENFKMEALKEALPKLLEHRFRPRFHESIDRSLQKGRELFIDLEEASLYDDRLREKNGRDEKRGEFFLLNRFWETVLRSRNFYDEALLYEDAVRRLREEGGAGLSFQSVFWLHHFPENPRIRHFREELSRHREVRFLHSSDLFSRTSAGPVRIRRTQSHSLEDGARHLIDEVLKSGDPDREAIVIEDRPEVRRTVQRVALGRGVNLQDARDPTLLSQSEELKAALLELEMVARNFPRELVLAWLGAREPGAGGLRRRIIEGSTGLGIRDYEWNPTLYQSLQAASSRYPRRMTLESLGESLSRSIRELGLPPWVDSLLARQIEEWKKGLKLIGKDQVKRPSRMWLKDLGERLKRASPPVPPVRFERGVRLYRADQAVSLALPPGVRIHFFGVSASFFDPREEATEWLSGRDLETLSNEFSLSDRRARKESARGAFSSWVSRSERDPIFCEYLHDEEGTEEESAELALQSLPGVELQAVSVLPVHPGVLHALTTRLKSSVSGARIDLPDREFQMSFLNLFGNCAFTAYSQYLLELFDERDPDFDLSGDAYGNVIHKAIELMLEQKTPDPEAAFDEAWKVTRKPAWVRSERLFRAMKRNGLLLLARFLEFDREYREKSGAELKNQERQLELKRQGFTFRGRADRIDQHADGLVLLDYKTGSKLPSGQATITTGKGLQLPAYSLALKDAENQEVVSAFYVKLSPDAVNRNSGILFKRWNRGKAADTVEFPLSFLRAGHSSLFPEEPEAVWKEFEKKISGLLETLEKGEFPAAPADPKDCEICRYYGVCGRGRAVIA